MIRSVLLIVSILYFFSAQGQSAIMFKSITYDFGIIPEQEGTISHDFQFINLTKDSIQISDIDLACDCLSPNWSREAIAPQDTGSVSLAFALNNRPGKFEKSATVQFNENTEDIVLTITGYVVPKSDDPLSKLDQRAEIIGYSSDIIALGTVQNNAIIKRQIPLYNYDSVSIGFDRWNFDLPSNISMSVDSVIKPKSFGNVILAFEPDENTKLGYQLYGMGLALDSIEISFELAVTVMEGVDSQVQMTKSKLVFDKSIHDFESAYVGEELMTSFTLTNFGEGTLSIKDIQTNCACTSAYINEKNIKPGQSTSMIVTFDTSGRRGRQYKMITVFSNDPEAPAQTVSLKVLLND
ncbi:MAG: DUF1573 domain-containing protein [Cyclobacteriaceae bacterium]